MKTRHEAFDIAGLALDLAQDLYADSVLCDPRKLKRRFRWFSTRVVMEEAILRQERIEKMTKDAYELYNHISDWADEYPLEEE